jgi:CDP-glucose 4,6-dehydratase
VEGVVSGFWRKRRVLVTGHTGFKGGWLCLWLHRMGAHVTGYALPPPTQPNLFDLARIGQFVDSRIGDVRDLEAVTGTLVDSKAEIVFHLAAQPLVLGGYSDPVGTFATNLMGTVNLLQAVRSAPDVRAVVNVTTDKCYRNDDSGTAFREADPLGGSEPYGTSKACSELATQAFTSSFFDPRGYSDHGVAIATARAGNVIGGGDWGENRLLPDIVRSFATDRPVMIRRPDATRPWQHVLEPLNGYLRLARRLTEAGAMYNGAWNFGPAAESERPVSWVVDRCAALWGSGARWERDGSIHPPEARMLQLDCAKARTALGWVPRTSLDAALEMTISWYRGVANGADARQLCEAQIAAYGDPESC